MTAAPAWPARSGALRNDLRHIRRSVAWNALGTMVSKGLSIVAKLVLARLLLPEHFGVVSMIVVFTSFARIVGDMGFQLGLIQRRRDGDTRLLYDSAFWTLAAVGLGLTAAMMAFGVPAIAAFYRAPGLTPIALAMSGTIFLQNLQAVPSARLARCMRFKQIALAEIAGMAAGAAGGVALALAGAGAWSLVAQALLDAGVTGAALFALSGWRPALRLRLGAVRELFRYSRFLVGSRLLVSLQQNLDYLVIGRMIGAHALGIYAIAFLVTETMRAQAYWLVSKAVYPFYSRASGRGGDIRSVYLGTVRYMAITVFPLATVLIAYADRLVPALFTSRWQAAVVPIQLLAAASMVIASAGTPSEVLRGIGRARLDFAINLAVTLFVAAPGLWLGVRWLGLPGAALAVLGCALASRLAYGVALAAHVGVGAGALVGAMRPALVGCAAMAAVRLAPLGLPWFAGLLLAALAYAALVLPIALALVRGALGPPAGRAIRFAR